MATTRLIAMHIGKGKTIAQSMKKKTDYAKNPEKTEDGSLVTSYACSPETVDQEFLMMRSEYLARTGRYRDDEVIAYQLRQSFKPGEITPEEANRIGYETAMRFLKGEHAFIVATHTDKHHIHNHVVLSSVALDCDHKFNNFLGSGLAFGRLSDEICRENQLSVVENKRYTGVSYDKWQGRKVKLTEREKLCLAIDEALKQQPRGFDALMQLLEDAGWSIKRGAQLSFKSPEGKRYMRMDTLGESYSEENLRAVLDGKRVHRPRKYRGYTGEVGLIIDIKEKIRQGKGKGYERWAEKYNLTIKSKMMVYLTTHRIDNLEMLKDRVANLTKSEKALHGEVNQINTRMNELIEMQRAIFDYRRTSEVFAQYKASNWSPKFLAEHQDEIDKYKAAVVVYKAHGGQLPKRSEISEEFERLKQQKQEKRNELNALRAELYEAQNIQSNVAEILGTSFDERTPPLTEKIFPRRKART